MVNHRTVLQTGITGPLKQAALDRAYSGAL